MTGYILLCVLNLFSLLTFKFQIWTQYLVALSVDLEVNSQAQEGFLRGRVGSFWSKVITLREALWAGRGL